MHMVALLRGINVGGHRKVPMAALCLAAEGAGFKDVKTYIQSGNLVFSAGRLSVAQTASRLEGAIEQRFGFAVDVIVRTEKQWQVYARSSPFPEAASDRPNLLMLGLAKMPLASAAAAYLRERAHSGERIKIVGDAIWIDFDASVGRSKLSPTVLDRAAGSAVTLRNWKTVTKLDEMLSGG